jgi:hypothetical protein
MGRFDRVCIWTAVMLFLMAISFIRSRHLNKELLLIHLSFFCLYGWLWIPIIYEFGLLFLHVVGRMSNPSALKLQPELVFLSKFVDFMPWTCRKSNWRAGITIASSSMLLCTQLVKRLQWAMEICLLCNKLVCTAWQWKKCLVLAVVVEKCLKFCNAWSCVMNGNSNCANSPALLMYRAVQLWLLCKANLCGLW